MLSNFDDTTGDSWPAGDARAMLATYVWVGVAMHHQRGANAAQNTEWAFGERDARREALEPPPSVLADADIREIACVEGVIDIRVGVARGPRVEMATRAFEFARTIGFFMDVHSMETWFQNTRVARKFEDDFYEPLGIKFELDEVRMPCDGAVAARNLRARSHDLLVVFKLMHP